MGIDPLPFTLAELAVMSRARQSDEWDRAAPLLCVLINANRDPKDDDPVRLSDIHPFMKRRKRQLGTVDDVIAAFT